MKYRLRAERQSRVVLSLSMPERVVTIGFLSLVSLVGLVGALAYALSAQDPGDPFRALCFGGVGLFCLSGIILVAGFRPNPSALVFDNTAGWLTVAGPGRPDHGNQDSAAIPYSGIAGFSVCRVVDQRMVRHSAGIDLVRGGRWELYASTKARRAAAYRDALAAAVTLGAAVRPRLAPGGGPAPEQRADGATRYSWKKKIRPVALAISLLVVMSFEAVLVGIGPLSSGPAAFAVALAFGAALLAVTITSLLRSLGQRVAVDITKSVITVERGAALVRTTGFSVPLSQVARVDLSMTLSTASTRIILLRPEEVDTFTRCRQGTVSPSEVIGMVSFLRNLLRIDVSALPPLERIALAEALREAVAHDPDPIR